MKLKVVSNRVVLKTTLEPRIFKYVFPNVHFKMAQIVLL